MAPAFSSLKLWVKIVPPWGVVALTLTLVMLGAAARVLSAGPAVTVSWATPSLPRRARAVTCAEPARPEAGFSEVSRYLTALDTRATPEVAAPLSDARPGAPARAAVVGLSAQAPSARASAAAPAASRVGRVVIRG